MKKLLLSLLLILCLSFQVSAFNPLEVMGGKKVSGVSYLFHETWNGATEDNTWTQANGGTWTDDDTTAPGEGAQCLYFGNAADYTAPVTSTGEIWVAFMINVPVGMEETNLQFPLKLYATADLQLSINLLWVAGQEGWLVRLYEGDGGVVVDSNDANTHYISSAGWEYIKVRYKPGTGANAEFELWTSTDGSTWNAHGSVSNQNETADINKIAMESDSSDYFYIDDIRIDNENINY